MQSDIFEEWLKKLDDKFHLESHQILLLVDNVTSHYNSNNDVLNSQDSQEKDEESSNSNQGESSTAGMINNHQNRHGRGRPKSSNTTRVDQQQNHHAILWGSKGKHGTSQGSVYRISNLSNQHLTNIKLKFLPSNIMAHFQLMNAGII